MSYKEYSPSRLDARLDRQARKSWNPAPFPWLSLALGAAAGVVFAYAVQESGAKSASEVFEHLSQVMVLALT